MDIHPYNIFFYNKSLLSTSSALMKKYENDIIKHVMEELIIEE